MCVVGACDVCVQYDVWCACMCVEGACDVCACSMMCGAPACVLWGHVMCVRMQYDVWCACMCVVGACDVCVHAV